MALSCGPKLWSKPLGSQRESLQVKARAEALARAQPMKMWYSKNIYIYIYILYTAHRLFRVLCRKGVIDLWIQSFGIP